MRISKESCDVFMASRVPSSPLEGVDGWEIRGGKKERRTKIIDKTVSAVVDEDGGASV